MYTKCPSSPPEVDSGEGSSRKVEEKLVEEYRSSSYFKDTKAELGTYKVDGSIL